MPHVFCFCFSLVTVLDIYFNKHFWTIKMLLSLKKVKYYTTPLPLHSGHLSTTSALLCPFVNCIEPFFHSIDCVKWYIWSLFYVLEHCQSRWNHRLKCLAQRDRISTIHWRRGHLWSSKHWESKSKNRGNEFSLTFTSLLLYGWEVWRKDNICD